MYYGFSVLTGVLIAGMIVLNGGLSDWYGVYAATVVIHAVGLAVVVLVLALRRTKLARRGEWSRWLYAGGAIGVGTTVFNNLAFGKISVSAILALGLLGQCITSLILDQFGLMGMERRPFRPIRLVGMALVGAGILWMTWPLSAGAVLAVLVSLMSGVTIVISRTLNSGLAQRIGEEGSTFYNYVIGLLVSLPLFLLMGRGEPAAAGLVFSENLPIYFGGAVGVAVVFLSNVTVHRVPAFYMTLLIFAGQVFTGLGLDALISRTLSAKTLAGGVLVTAGLALDLLLARRAPLAKED